MPNPRIRARQVPQPTPRDDGMRVDWKDVLDQAVINERLRVVREIRNAVEQIPTSEHRDSYSYSRDNRSADAFKRDVKSVIDRFDREA